MSGYWFLPLIPVTCYGVIAIGLSRGWRTKWLIILFPGFHTFTWLILWVGSHFANYQEIRFPLLAGVFVSVFATLAFHIQAYRYRSKS